MGGPASALGLIRARFSARLSPAWRGFRGGLNWLYKVLDGSTTAIWQDLSRLHGHRHNVGQQVAFLELVGLLKAKTIKQLLCKLEVRKDAQFSGSTIEHFSTSKSFRSALCASLGDAFATCP